MPYDIDFNDPDAWDDSELVDSWNQALKEYQVNKPTILPPRQEHDPNRMSSYFLFLTHLYFQKYHSIHLAGKNLSDVLTPAELKELEE